MTMRLALILIDALFWRSEIERRQLPGFYQLGEA